MGRKGGRQNIEEWKEGGMMVVQMGRKKVEGRKWEKGRERKRMGK